MNIIRDRELVLRFKNDGVPSQERFAYLIIHIVLTAAPTSWLFTHDPNAWDAYLDAVLIISVVIGTVICYHVNHSGDDRDFHCEVYIYRNSCPFTDDLDRRSDLIRVFHSA